jgi:hypothetical protein
MNPRLFAALLTVFVSAGPALAQNADILRFVPEDASAFVVVQNIGAANEQVTQLAKAVHAPLPETVLASFKKFLSIDKALDEKGSGLALLFRSEPGNTDPVEAAMVVPVTSYEQFLQETKAVKGKKGSSEIQTSDGEKLLVARAGQYAVIVPKDRKGILEKVLAAGKGTGALKGLSKDLAKNDISAVLTRRGIEDVAKAWDQAAQGWKLLFDNGKPQLKELQELIETGSQFVHAAEQSVTGVVVGVRFNDKGNLRVSVRAPFRKESVFAKAAATFKTPSGGLLNDLPGKAPVAAYGFVVPKTARAAYLKFLTNILTKTPDALPPGQGPELVKALESMLSFDSQVQVFYPRAKDAPLFGANVISVYHAADARTFLTNYTKALKMMMKAGKPGPGGEPPLTVRQVKVGDREVVEFSGGAEAKDVFSKLILGPEGKIKASMAVVDEHTLITTLVPAEEMAKVLTQIKGTSSRLSDQAEVKQLATKIPAGSQFLFLFSPHRASVFAEQVLAKTGGAEKLPIFPKTPLVGFGIYVAPEGTQAELILPQAVIENAPAYIEKVQQWKAPGAGS